MEEDIKKELIRSIEKLSGKYSSYEVFSDWVKMMALAIENSCNLHTDGKVWKKNEQMYIDTAHRYTAEELTEFSKMFYLLTRLMDSEMGDVLGEIYMESGMGSKAAGQFFTPYHVSRLCAELAAPEPDEKGIYRINEPSCGGGGMIIAVAEALKKRGIDYQRKMDVVAQDLDWKGVYMCYVQLSLYGIRAVCVQGDTLRSPYDPKKTDKMHILTTPAKRGLLWTL